MTIIIIIIIVLQYMAKLLLCYYYVIVMLLSLHYYHCFSKNGIIHKQNHALVTWLNWAYPSFPSPALVVLKCLLDIIPSGYILYILYIHIHIVIIVWVVGGCDEGGEPNGNSLQQESYIFLSCTLMWFRAVLHPNPLRWRDWRNFDRMLKDGFEGDMFWEGFMFQFDTCFMNFID